MGDLDTQGGGKYRTIEDGVITSIDGGNTFSIKVSGRDYDYVGVNGTWYDADNVEGEDVRIGFVQGSAKLPVLITRGSKPNSITVSDYISDYISGKTWHNPVEGDESGRGHSHLLTPGAIPSLAGEATEIVPLEGGASWDQPQLGIIDSGDCVFVFFPADWSLSLVDVGAKEVLWTVSAPSDGEPGVWWIDSLQLFLVQNGRGNIYVPYDPETNTPGYFTVDWSTRNTVWLINREGEIVSNPILSMGGGKIFSVAADGSFFAARLGVSRWQITPSGSGWSISKTDTVEADSLPDNIYSAHVLQGRTASGEAVYSTRFDPDNTSLRTVRLSKNGSVIRSHTDNLASHAYLGNQTLATPMRGVSSMSGFVFGDTVLGVEVRSEWYDAWATDWKWYGPGVPVQTFPRSGYCNTLGYLFSETAEEQFTLEYTAELVEFESSDPINYPVGTQWSIYSLRFATIGNTRLPIAGGIIETGQRFWEPDNGPNGLPRVNHGQFPQRTDVVPSFALDRSPKLEFRDSISLDVLYSIDYVADGATERKALVCASETEGWAIVHLVKSRVPRLLRVKWTKIGEGWGFEHTVSEGSYLGRVDQEPADAVGVGSAIFWIVYDGGWKLDRYS